MTQDQIVPPHPVVAIDITDDEIRLNGNVISVRSDDADPYAVAVHAVARQVAQGLGRPVWAVATDAGCTTRLVIHPDGTTSDVTESATEETEGVADLEEMVNGPSAPEAPAAATPRADSGSEAASTGASDAGSFFDWEPAPQPEPVVAEATAIETVATPAPPFAPAETSRPEAAQVPPTDRGAVDEAGKHSSFVRREVPIAPAEDGWRGALNRMGMRLAPSAHELEVRSERDAVSEFYVNARTIAVANPKGGAGKTVTSALLSAVFASGRGGNVLTADLNTTRGSLGWRTQQGRHAATVVDLLPQVERLSAVETQASALAGFVHHQLTDKYDVLQSDQSVAGEHEMSADDVVKVHTLVSRFWGLIVCDSGNSERAENWRAMIDRADALVVPCTNSADSAEGARLMLEALKTRDEHSRDLAARAIVIVSQRDRTTKAVRSEMKSIVEGMLALGAETITIPFDPAMQEGVLHFKALRPATKRAWLRAGAAIARTL